MTRTRTILEAKTIFHLAQQEGKLQRLNLKRAATKDTTELESLAQEIYGITNAHYELKKELSEFQKQVWDARTERILGENLS